MKSFAIYAALVLTSFALVNGQWDQQYAATFTHGRTVVNTGHGAQGPGGGFGQGQWDQQTAGQWGAHDIANSGQTSSQWSSSQVQTGGNEVTGGSHGIQSHGEFGGQNSKVGSSAQWQTATPSPPTTTTAAPYRQCVVDGVWYNPGQDISSGRSGDWCYGSYCGFVDGQVKYWDDYNCPTAAPQPPTPRYFPPTTTPNPYGGCFYNGRWYAPGMDIVNNRNMYGMCSGVYCDHNSRVQQWEDNCMATVAPSPSNPMNVNLMSSWFASKRKK